MVLFLSYHNKLFTVLGKWAWVFVAIIAVAAVLIFLNRKVIGEILSSQNPRFHISDNRKFKRACMIGDRATDVIGGNENRIDGIGVLYGYGSREELEEAS